MPNKIAGWLMVCSPLIAVFVIVGTLVGWLVAMMALTLTAVSVGLITFGLDLIDREP